jgi:hypothetical protein
MTATLAVAEQRAHSSDVRLPRIPHISAIAALYSAWLAPYAEAAGKREEKDKAQHSDRCQTALGTSLRTSGPDATDRASFRRSS